MKKYCRRDHWFPCEGLLFAFLFVLAAFILMGLSGCSPMAVNRAGDGATAGGANYTMSCGVDGTSEILVNSGREVNGVSVVVDGRNCTIKAVVEDTESITVSPETLTRLLNH